MTENTWPDPARPGVPRDPEKEGWHWLKRISNGWETLAKWDNDWNGNDDFWWNLPGYSDPERVAKGFQYLGPVATPEEIAAKDARIAALEAAITQCKALSAMLKPQADRIAELEAALATARREGMEEAAKIAFDYAVRLEDMAELTRYPHVKREHEGRSWVAQKIAAAIRTAAKEGKDE